MIGYCLIKFYKQRFLIFSLFLWLLFFSWHCLAEEIMRVRLGGENEGIVEIKLRSDLAPNHVNRVKKLVMDGKYNGVAFHRVIDGFMAQTGDVKYGKMNQYDANKVGMGGSELPDLYSEFSNQPFVMGTVGMARSQSIHSANSQFFIMFAEAPHLNNNYTVIGEVVSGMDSVLNLKKGNLSDNGSVVSPDFIVSIDLFSE